MEKCRNKNEEIIGQNEMRTNIVLFIYTYIIKKKYIYISFIYLYEFIHIYLCEIFLQKLYFFNYRDTLKIKFFSLIIKIIIIINKNCTYIFFSEEHIIDTFQDSIKYKYVDQNYLNEGKRIEFHFFTLYFFSQYYVLYYKIL